MLRPCPTSRPAPPPSHWRSACPSGGATYATAASQSSSSSASPGNPNEQALTGDTAEKVKAAALAKLPGATILRVETDEGGVYEAHVRKTDGTEAEVHVGEDFAVTSVDTRPAGGPGDPGGRGHGGPGGGRVDTAALAKTLGVTEDKVQAALDKVRPAKGDRDDKRTAWTAAIAKALGQSTADVQAVLDANRPSPPSAGTPRRSSGPPSRMTQRWPRRSPRSSGSPRTRRRPRWTPRTATRTSRGDELAAALAKELGLDATKVNSALEALRPDRP